MLDNYEIIDLTQDIYVGMPVNVGFPAVERTILSDHAPNPSLEKCNSFYYGSLHISEHSGTHVDSISHMVFAEDASHIDKMDVRYFHGRGVAVDFKNVADNTRISLKEVKQRLAFYKLEIKEGDTFLYTCGHYKKHYPRKGYITACSGLSKEAAEYIYGHCGAINIGVDAPSIDSFGDDDYPAHFVCRKYRRVNTENLCNIEAVIGRGFYYMGLPLRIRAGSGSPIRAVAFVGN